MSIVSRYFQQFSRNVDFPKFQNLNLGKCKTYSRKIEMFKCQYAHFAHIHLSFGCTDEQIDFGLYSDTYGKIPKFPKSKIWKLKSCNVSGSIFRISKNPKCILVGGATLPQPAAATALSPQGGVYPPLRRKSCCCCWLGEGRPPHQDTFWIFGYAENAPRHITRFQFSNLWFWKFGDFSISVGI